MVGKSSQKLSGIRRNNMPKQKQVLRTQVPIIGEYSNFRDALTELMQKFIIPTINQIGTELGILNARIEELEKASKSINVFINPKEIQKIFQPEKDAELIEKELNKNNVPIYNEEGYSNEEKK
jgi:hypothetical protein